MEWRVLWATTIPEIEKKVNQYLADGWDLYGGLVLGRHTNNYDLLLCQVVTRKKNK
jgi:hypothetical protein